MKKQEKITVTIFNSKFNKYRPFDKAVGPGNKFKINKL